MPKPKPIYYVIDLYERKMVESFGDYKNAKGKAERVMQDTGHTVVVALGKYFFQKSN